LLQSPKISVIAMNKTKATVLLLVLIFSFFPVFALGAEPTIGAKAAVLIDTEEGQLLWERNKDLVLPPASTTKILTAVLGFELGNLESICFVSDKAASVGEASLYLRPGEKLRLKELLTGALMRSGNDACVAIAENVAGSEGLFVQWMNLKAQTLGGSYSCFRNTNGLPDKKHVVTAYELALISRYAMHNEAFAQVVGKRFATIGAGASKRYLKNTNKLLWQFPGCIGIKTGTTVAAGQCLVSAVDRDGERYIAVVLNSPDRYGDSKRLLDYGINHFSRRKLLNAGQVVVRIPVQNGTAPEVPGVVLQDEIIIWPDDAGEKPKLVACFPEHISAPVTAGESIGHIDIMDKQGRLMKRVNVATGCDVSRLSLFGKFLDQFLDRLKWLGGGKN